MLLPAYSMNQSFILLTHSVMPLKHKISLTVSGAITYLALSNPLHLESKLRPVDQPLKDLHIRPGLYIWGSNKYGLVNARDPSEVIKTPTRIPFFDGRLLRDLALGEEIAVAVLENGDIAQWGSTSDDPRIIVKGFNVEKVGIADWKCVYALTKNGIIAWPARHTVTIDPVSNWSIWKPWTYFYKTPQGLHRIPLDTSLGLTERITDIQVGQDHVLALTSYGRVFSGATGLLESDKPINSKGQFGIASFSQFNDSPVPGKLFHIKLLQEFSPIAQIAAGDYHSLVRTKDGKLLAFGENVYGQLGIPYSYRIANIAVPTVLQLEKLFRHEDLPLSTPWQIRNIAAGGSVSYFTAANGPHSLVYAVGNGSLGHLGVGNYIHSQSDPTKLKTLNNLTEYSERHRKVVPIDILKWSAGATHTAVTLNSFSEQNFKDVLLWGGNEFFQLGTGKRNNRPAPIGIPVDHSHEECQSRLVQLLEKAKLTFRDHNNRIRTTRVSQEIVAGRQTTAIYSRVA